ncbi:MAG: ATP-binding protein [Myxococcota bacterium]
MTALLYFMVAVLAVALSVAAFLDDRQDPARQAYLALCAGVALAYLGFSLSLLPGLEEVRALYLLAGCAVPPGLLWTFDRAFLRDDLPPTGPMRLVFGGSVLVGPVATLGHLALGGGTSPSPPALAAGAFAFYGFGVALHRLWVAHQATNLRIDRARMRYLLGVIGAAVVLTALEQVGRILFPPVDPRALSLTTRAVALQGPLPPFSAVFTGLATYFLYHSVVMSRLLDVTELLSRLATVLLSATALVLIDGLTFLWVDTFTVYPLHSTFQIFLASTLFLAAYDPLRSRIAWLANRLFDRRSHQLTDVLDQLRRQLPAIIDLDTLVARLLDGLSSSGRAPNCSVYVWDSSHEAFVCAGWRGPPDDQRPLQVVAASPFTDRFARGAPWYLRTSVTRRAHHDPQQAEVLALMDAMNADLTVPLLSGRVVLGWLHLRDEPWSDGYSAEEILALQEVSSLASVVLANVQGFAAVEEQKRLAALGAMSAGLAHEIRNPLAGIKGAAQLLQGETADGEARDMLSVIVDETNRLNHVVTEFLDYARPFELQIEEVTVDTVVRRALAVVKAQGIPEDVELVEEMAPDLPPVELDALRAGQVLLNLLQNALQAMPAGGTLTVRTREGRERSGRRQIEVHVVDTGQGIADDALEQLFVPFFTTKQDGTGLGLAICQRIVHAHRGEIDVRTEVGRGSSFVVRFPQTVDPSERPRAVAHLNMDSPR